MLMVALDHDNHIIQLTRKSIVEIQAKISSHRSNKQYHIVTSDTANSQSFDVLSITVCSPKKVFAVAHAHAIDFSISKLETKFLTIFWYGQLVGIALEILG